MFKNIYKDKSVLITGHTGFKGSWLSIWLKELGADVIGYSLDPPSTPNIFEASKLQTKITHFRDDIRNYESLLTVFDQAQPEFVFHLAAQPLVRLSYNEPKMTFDTNIGGTVNVLEAARSTPSVKTIIIVTSDKCYENREWIWGYRENDPIGGIDPYSASKGCAELVFNSYLKSFFSKMTSPKNTIGAASVRAGNVFGGGDWGKDRLIPDCVRALSSGQEIGIRNPNSIRPWQHVLEPLSGYLWMGALLFQDPVRYSGAWNFGPEDGSHITTIEMVERFVQYWGSGSWQDLSNPGALHEARFLKLNCDKVHAELLWRSVLDIDEGLKMTAYWFKKFFSVASHEDMYAIGVDQIREYSDQATLKKLAWTVD